MAQTTLNTLPTELVEHILNQIPWNKYTSAIVASPPVRKPASKGAPPISYYDTLRALCLCSRRLNAICTPHLYRRFEERTAAGDSIGMSVPNQRLLLLLRTLIRKPELGRHFRQISAGTWHSLDTELLTEDDMKAVFRQAGVVTTNYPLRVAVGRNIYLGNPPDHHSEGHAQTLSPAVARDDDRRSNGTMVPWDGFQGTMVREFASDPQVDFPFCSTSSWCHAVRRGDWDAIFTLLLSYLPSLETLAVYNPDAGDRCPFAQCIYLTSFMERVAISQQMSRKSQELKRVRLDSNIPLYESDGGDDTSQTKVGSSKRKRIKSDPGLSLPAAKRQKCQNASNMLSILPTPQDVVAKRLLRANHLRKYFSQPSASEEPQQWIALLPRLRSVTLDCIYTFSDVDLDDGITFVRPQSVEEFDCGYLYGGSWPGDTKLNLKSLTIRNGHMAAETLATFIRCCTQLRSLRYDTAGGAQLGYQALASSELMDALDTVADSLEHLDLLRADMNYWNPQIEVVELMGYTAYTWRSFAEFIKLRSLYLKAETLVRRSELDPEADTGPLWKKLPPSLEDLRLAGNKKWFGNLIPQLQDLLVKKGNSKNVVPKLQQIVLEFRLAREDETQGEGQSPRGSEDGFPHPQRRLTDPHITHTISLKGRAGAEPLKMLADLLDDVLATAPMN